MWCCLDQTQVNVLCGFLEMSPWVFGLRGLLDGRIGKFGMDFVNPFLYVLLRHSMTKKEVFERLEVLASLGASKDNT